MNRRNFLRSGSLAVLAASGLPKAVRSMNYQTSPVTYRTKPDAAKSGQWLYEIAINHKAVDSLSSADDEEKLITLKVAYFETTDLTQPSQQGEYRYKIQKSVLNKDNNVEWIITTKFDKKVSGDHKFGKEFPKNPKLRCSKFSYIEILAKDGSILQTLPYPATSSSSGSGQGCFLTTACVTHKQLADDCYELQQLRSLRDQFMLAGAEGRELVKQYRSIGPSIVQAINSCDNKNEIYEYMYDRMIVPAVQLVEQNKKAAAVEYYKLFVKALAEQYN